MSISCSKDEKKKKETAEIKNMYYSFFTGASIFILQTYS